MSHRPTTTATHRARRRARARAVAALAAGAALIASPATVGAGTASASSSCGITWGSLPKTSAPFAVGRVDGVRAGRHACFDRLVIDSTGRAPGFDVRYVSTVTADGSGFPVPVAGGARLAVVVHQGATSIPPVPAVAGFTTFRQVKWAGSFEGYTTVALGVRARLPHRVFTIHDAATNRSRVVVDVAHGW